MNDKDKIEDRPVCEICKSSENVVFVGFKYNFLRWGCKKCRIKFETPMKGTK